MNGRDEAIALKQGRLKRRRRKKMEVLGRLLARVHRIAYYPSSGLLGESSWFFIRERKT